MKRLFGYLAPLLVILLCSHASAQSLDNQERCSLQAKKEYDLWKADQIRLQLISSEYQSHFNTKISKCLMLLTADYVGGSNLKFLEDSFERRIYAMYYWSPSSTKKYWEVPPSICELTPSTLGKKNCSSVDEFDSFVATYLED